MAENFKLYVLWIINYIVLHARLPFLLKLNTEWVSY